MAKYRLEKNRKKSVNCEVLHENLNGYIVRFDNGMIKNVKKSNVYAFDKIDEAVLDDIRAGFGKIGRRITDAGERVYSKVKKWFKVLFEKIGDVIFFRDVDGEYIASNHPINIMKAAKETKGVGYIPSNATISLCNEIGESAEAVEYIFDNCFYNGAIGTQEIYESCVSNNLLSIVLNEESYPEIEGVSTKEYITLSSKDGIEDYDLEGISDLLTSLYLGKITKEYDVVGASKMPIIYGAPGIGKTTIIKDIKNRSLTAGLKNELGEPLGSPTVITVNATTVNPDTFTLPAKVKKVINCVIKNGIDVHDAERDGVVGGFEVGETVKDLPKTWLPVYDSLDDNGQEKDEDYLIKANALANGGKLVVVDGEEKVVNGPGGLFFVDEFTRMDINGMNSLMGLTAGGDLGQGLLFGDRWLICGASNRPDDVSDEAFQEGFKYEMANLGRITMMNYVPDPKDWIEWANSINKRTNKPNVFPDIVSFVSKSLNDKNDDDYMGYFYFSVNITKKHGSKSTMNLGLPKATPREWEVISNQIRAKIGKRYNTIAEYLGGISDEALQTKEINAISKLVSANVGKFIGEEFKNYINGVVKTLTYDFVKCILNNGYEYYIDNPTINKELFDYLLSVRNRTSEDFPTIFSSVVVPFVKQYMTEEAKKGNAWYKQNNILHEDQALNLIDFVYYYLTKDGTDNNGKLGLFDTIVVDMRELGVNSSSGKNITHPTFVNHIGKLRKTMQ